jgi:hypothetical protein
MHVKSAHDPGSGLERARALAGPALEKTGRKLQNAAIRVAEKG